MKAIFHISEEELSSCVLKKKNKVIQWGDLTKEEQNKLLKSIASFYNLFSKFIKPE